jgi:putative exosortase-associated protein (TIGR04073 family)
MKQVVSIVLAIALITSFTTLAHAQNPPVKLGRGIINTLTGFLELPLKVITISKKEGYPVGLTVGVAKGIGWGLYRTVVGLYEIVTFPIPAPAGYEPITDPDTLLTYETLSKGDPSMAVEFTPLKKEISGKRSSRRVK